MKSWIRSIVFLASINILVLSANANAEVRENKLANLISYVWQGGTSVIWNAPGVLLEVVHTPVYVAHYALDKTIYGFLGMVGGQDTCGSSFNGYVSCEDGNSRTYTVSDGNWFFSRCATGIITATYYTGLFNLLRNIK